MKTLLLISGGLDSCVSAAHAAHFAEPIAAMSVNYGQRHSRELQHAALIAKHFNVPHHIVDMSAFGTLIAKGTALVQASKSEELPADRPVETMSAEIPRSYVPGRNSILLSLAQSVAEALGAQRVVCGFNAVDYSGYPDCRPEFVTAWNNLALYATKSGVERKPILVEAPIIKMTKIEVVKHGIRMNAPMHLTWSCYEGEQTPCGKCDSCILRAEAFKTVGIDDPALVWQASNPEAIHVGA